MAFAASDLVNKYLSQTALTNIRGNLNAVERHEREKRDSVGFGVLF